MCVDDASEEGNRRSADTGPMISHSSRHEGYLADSCPEFDSWYTQSGVSFLRMLPAIRTMFLLGQDCHQGMPHNALRLRFLTEHEYQCTNPYCEGWPRWTEGIWKRNVF
jgi:hypothetical protein